MSWWRCETARICFSCYAIYEKLLLATPLEFGANKKGKREFTFFAPNLTMNLTYLCYGMLKYNITGIKKKQIFPTFRLNAR